MTQKYESVDVNLGDPDETTVWKTAVLGPGQQATVTAEGESAQFQLEGDSYMVYSAVVGARIIRIDELYGPPLAKNPVMHFFVTDDD